MGKGAAKFGFKSGILPTTRSILKNPTTKQTTLVEKANAPKPTGRHGIGYAENVQHPRNSTREQPPVKFVDVETLIKKTVPEPSQDKKIISEAQSLKAKKAELRRGYFAAAFRQEEERLLKTEQWLQKKEKLIEEERIKHLEKIERVRTSDLTIPSLDRIIKGPLMRQRTPEETELLQMKRKYNREYLEFKAKEKRMEKLLNLFYASSEFIVTTKQLTKVVDEVFASDGSEFLRTKNRNVAERIKIRNENAVSDALFGSVSGGSYPGLPVIREYLSGEMNEFAEQIEANYKKQLIGENNDLDQVR